LTRIIDQRPVKPVAAAIALAKIGKAVRHSRLPRTPPAGKAGNGVRINLSCLYANAPRCADSSGLAVDEFEETAALVIGTRCPPERQGGMVEPAAEALRRIGETERAATPRGWRSAQRFRPRFRSKRVHREFDRRGGIEIANDNAVGLGNHADS